MKGLLLVGVLAAGFLWLISPREETAPPQEPSTSDIDRWALEAAEREVRDLGATPEDGSPGVEWGPGTPRPPERL
jgi:hypothetical protein